MRIQHNIMAMNSYRNFSNNTKAVGKNLEKLSSGYRINNAGDDAAGLAVSEKMRAQITGLKTAQKNAKDGISLVKTAEGALTEVHSMLNRMVDLAGQSANGTYDNEVDRANLQKEVSALKEEINRIADSSNFNGIKLLDGSMTGKVDVSNVVMGGVAPTGTIDKAAAASSFTSGAVGVGTAAAAKLSVTYKDADGSEKVLKVDYTGHGTAANNLANMKEALSKDANVSKLFDVSDDGAGNLVLTSKTKGADAPSVTGITSDDVLTTAITSTGASSVSGTGAGKTFTGATIKAGDSVTIGGKTFAFVTAGQKAPNGTTAVEHSATPATLTANLQKALEDAGIKNVAVKYSEAGAVGTLDVTSKGSGLTLQIGDTAQDFNQMKVSIGDMHAVALGIDGINISTQAGGAAAMESIKNAINSVSSTRGDLGALQNRLDHTINNLSVMHENIQDAEATIRDTDVADEMMAYTKNNILVQSAQAMLAQANQVPQGVLQLLG